MKRLITSAVCLMLTIVLTACGVPAAKGNSSRENKLDEAFESEVDFSLEKLDADGTICRYGDGEWSVEFDSPNTLSGVKLEFSEGEVNASYKGLEFSVPQSALPVKAMMLNLMEAVDSTAKLEKLCGEEKESGLELTGTLESGEYSITVDGEGRLKCFEMPNYKLKIDFRQPSVTSTKSEE